MILTRVNAELRASAHAFGIGSLAPALIIRNPAAFAPRRRRTTELPLSPVILSLRSFEAHTRQPADNSGSYTSVSASH